jgi:hypothetical protein
MSKTEKEKLKQLTDKYSRMATNIRWHIDTNKPTGTELKECALQCNDFNEVVNDLKSLIQK